jgi:enamine deaminase RidA (YjgF/YER057c/UK114 family)
MWLGPCIVWKGACGTRHEEPFASDRLADQARQALANVVAVPAEAGAGPQQIVRMTWNVTDKREYMEQSRELGAAYRELIGDFGVAMTELQVPALI